MNTLWFINPITAVIFLVIAVKLYSMRCYKKNRLSIEEYEKYINDGYNVEELSFQEEDMLNTWINIKAFIPPILECIAKYPKVHRDRLTVKIPENAFMFIAKDKHKVLTLIQYLQTKYNITINDIDIYECTVELTASKFSNYEWREFDKPASEKISLADM